ncbi:MAG: hypothetical protein JHC35_02495 [Sulfuricurvum sp.]|jgi:hypothetical protein|uniref:5'-methylthioadenosine/S-adenosylhomocysteine nucleosidase family protein n=1 Tax=Sulfuricurvum sp. TaxID=2025608 RepID=UPI0025F795D9|nr:hypothetical protein [Sulfuricurvum sp.]MCI4406140.1 hypothetical protein [Sulfuricurvum sp.]
MIYIIAALDAEARALVDYYQLKRDSALPYTLYTNERIILLVSGMGKSNALMAVSALLGWKIPKNTDILINIGICGAPAAYEIGEALLIHQIQDETRRYYPDILYTHSLRESPLTCVDEAQSALHDAPVDMESSAIFQAASRFFKLHQMAFVKIVSDHFAPETVSKEGVVELIRSNLDALDEVCSALEHVQSPDTLYTEDEYKEVERLKSYFTKAQGSALDDALNYFRLKHPTMPLPAYPDIPDSKRERKRALEELIAHLTA